jgi:2,4-dienoyl-CoA reductase-like NADH-dependent reductase (Old Yellow Enzyme family)
MMPTLFDPIDYGQIPSANRIVMAPMTRGRSTPDHIPISDLKATYYSQRATAGLIITEATGISPEGLGWPDAPGIWSQAQVEAWAHVTDAVHDAGGKIVLQLWHMGRLVHPSFTGGQLPLSASATKAPGFSRTRSGPEENVEARAMTRADIEKATEDHAKAARNAIAAGFDGVQIHAANGYLIDQFLRDNCNFRDDDYGGPVENRIRLLQEITAAVISEVGAGRVGVRLSPNGDSQGVEDSDPVPLFTAAAAALDAMGIAFLELRELGPESMMAPTDVPRLSPDIRPIFRGPLILNQDYDRQKADADIETGLADAISFGRAFIANPDLVRRLRSEVPLADGDWSTFYSEGGEGYTDYAMSALAE